MLPRREARVVNETMDWHRSAVWLSDRYSTQQGHAEHHQTCLAHLAYNVAYTLDAGDDTLALRLKLQLDGAFALARTITTGAPSTVTTKRRNLERSLGDILAAPAIYNLSRDQLLTFASFPVRVEVTNDACERDLRPAVIQRKNTNGYRAMWSANGEAAVRTVVATARIISGAGAFSTVLDTIGT